MPNVIDANGLQTATRDEIVTNFNTALEAIYGADIVLTPDTPDGQWIGIMAQATIDLEDLLTQIYNSFDPDNAVGVILDQRCAINGIQRRPGTFTITNITIVTSQALNLYGLDQAVQEIFTVADNAGNQFQLQTSQSIAGPGTYVYSFQAALPGAVLTVPNTITVPVTIVLGVDSINNPTSYTTLGVNEETDAALRLRRQQSVSLPSQGYLAGLLAALENITGVSAAFVYENDTGITNGDGVPGHSIWCIVAGTGASVDIATAIYNKRNAGCGMFGSQSYTITQLDGSLFIINWDVVVAETLFIKFTASSLDGINPPNIAAIRAGLPNIFLPGVAQQVNINDLATFVQQIDANTLVTSAGFSTSQGGSYTNTLTPSTKNRQFVITSADITILPMIFSPASATVLHGATQQFTALGGYGTITYSFQTNNSSGTIDSSTGLYTAGGTHPVTDTILATDSVGDTVTATVTVT